MDTGQPPLHTNSRSIVRTAHVLLSDADPVAALARHLNHPATPLAFVALFVAPEADFARVMAQAHKTFAGAQVVGCTTAGEISATGYCEGGIGAIGLPADLFSVQTLLLDRLDRLDPLETIGQTIRTRAALAQSAPDMPHEFAFLMVDGLSLKEDELAAALASGLGPVPLFGGSAGDGTRFAATHVAIGAQTAQNAAVLTLVRSHCPVRVFSLNHFTPTDQRMVVTSADPTARIVHQINAEPAARELARIVGMDPEQIDTFTFAGNPVVVRFGGDHHVRAIKRVTEQGGLEIFSAIDEGMVLTLATANDMVAHLARGLADLAADRKPDCIIACDCLLRRIEAEQKQLTHQISTVLAANNVAGFCTYGEQINSMHVNQTMTGVAIYPPQPTPPQ